MTFADVKAGKLSTHMETADEFVDDIVATARKLGTDRAKRAADMLEKWDRNAEATSDGMLLFYRFMHGRRPGLPIDRRLRRAARRPPARSTTPRGFADPAKAAAAARYSGRADGEGVRVAARAVGRRVAVPPRQRRSAWQRRAVALGAIRTVDPGPLVNGKAEGVRGDTYFAVIEFSTPVHAEALLTYGNWSKRARRTSRIRCRLNSKKEMRPVWRDRKDIEANLESRKVF